MGRDVIGFYKDSNGRTRPRTRRKRRVFQVKFSPSTQEIPLRKSVVNATITYVLSQAPVVKEIYTAYIVADALHSNWSSIAQLYSTYEKEGMEGVANVIGTGILHDTLSSTQASIAWATINPFIPKEYHNMSKQILASIMDRVTSMEIKLAQQFLQPSERSGSATYNSTSCNDKASKAHYGKNLSRKRMPKEVDYV